ncbi:Indoleamine 2,3-dioxygenase [Vararia minispora EC-137]|uniref:Indoleamine 2,3-dioxygenase n=1 Tax=Vararia minispora EC-137 TaxID=1314806 RepID=A0ACB8QLW7_9AGAM|nr:Indoleamine 2,3-dioxygenase [Vararia minispora EC-137]
MNPRRLTGDARPRAMLPMDQYDIDPTTGFFPPRPLPRLTGRFGVWECALDEAVEKLSLGEDTRAEAKAKRMSGETWRAQIRSMPLLDTQDLLVDYRILQRAHKVLAFLIQFYVHSRPPSNQASPLLIPRCLAVPIVQVSRVLGIAPVLTFADTVLWNVEPIDSSRSMSASNMRFVHLFSGTEAEHEFYMSSAKAELVGVELLNVFENYLHSPNPADLLAVATTAKDIAGIAKVIKRITDVATDIKNHVPPSTFYWDVRPWYRGSAASGDPESRWIYEGVENSDKLDLSGPSAGQSTVMHAIDVFLDVDHKQQQRRSTPATEANKKADKNFMERMWRYMPGVHHQYLKDLRDFQTPIRSLARESPLLRDAYDKAVLSLKEFRDAHLQVATLYVISMARTAPPGTSEEAEERASFSAKGPSRGTGGMVLATQLKSGRDSTTRTLLGSKP